MDTWWRCRRWIAVIAAKDYFTSEGGAISRITLAVGVLLIRVVIPDANAMSEAGVISFTWIIYLATPIAGDPPPVLGAVTLKPSRGQVVARSTVVTWVTVARITWRRGRKGGREGGREGEGGRERERGRGRGRGREGEGGGQSACPCIRNKHHSSFSFQPSFSSST